MQKKTPVLESCIKKRSSTGVFLWILRNIKEFFEEHLRTAAFAFLCDLFIIMNNTDFKKWPCVEPRLHLCCGHTRNFKHTLFKARFFSMLRLKHAIGKMKKIFNTTFNWE